MNVHVHVERLVLDGFQPGDARGIAAAFESALTEAIGEQTWASSQSVTTPSITAPPIAVPTGGAHTLVGQRLGRSVSTAVRDARA